MSSVDAQLKYLRGSAKEIAGVRLTIEIVAAEQRNREHFSLFGRLSAHSATNINF